ncbi:hypothetical protein OC834_008005, partial [Tilletia horrida]
GARAIIVIDDDDNDDAQVNSPSPRGRASGAQDDPISFSDDEDDVAMAVDQVNGSDAKGPPLAGTATSAPAPTPTPAPAPTPASAAAAKRGDTGVEAGPSTGHLSHDRSEPIPQRTEPVGEQRSGEELTYKRQLPSEGSLFPWQSSTAATAGAQQESTKKRIFDEVLSFSRWLAPSGAEQQVRDKAISKITAALHRRLQSFHLVSFGSRVTQTAQPTADLDLNVTMNVKSGQEPNTLRDIERALQSIAVPETCRVIKARVPIVKLKLAALKGLSVDITLDKPSGPRSSDFVCTLIQQYPLIRPITMFLKM